MEEEIETLSEKTLSDDNSNQLEPEGEWVDDIIPDESVSQVAGDNELNSEIIASDISGSTVWLYFDKSPLYALGYNICKKCNKKFKVTTGVTTLRTHLKTHQLVKLLQETDSCKKPDAIVTLMHDVVTDSPIIDEN